MKLIVGLGNPGFQYENTRHNVGFMVIDEIAKKMNLNINQKKFDSLLFVNSDFIL
ncbi:MAG: aminoacyl-tRNA hydrolase, partial [Mycoplasmataceae bacterium]|nr:aminoacyl-tRNA hydrolase [Mycoplasmataceae bacterium]